MSTTATTSGVVHGARVVLRSGRARRLVAVRLIGQGCDGALQGSLASLFFLSPERATTAGGVALASAVLLLPFTLVGPWAAGLLDRWQRRSVLITAGVVRAGSALAVAAAVAAGQDVAVAVLVLGYLSVNRVLLAALSACLPRVVARADLVAANAIVPTLGSAAAFGGAALAVGLPALLGAARGDSPLVPLTVAAGCLLAAAVAAGFPRDALGPDPTPPAPPSEPQPQALPQPLPPTHPRAPDVPHGVAPLRLEPHGATPRGTGSPVVGAESPSPVAVLRHLRVRRPAGRALALVTGHRLAYGVALVCVLLLARNRFAGSLAEATAVLGSALAASGAGFAVAALLTPVAVRRWGADGWTSRCCWLSAAAPAALLLAPGPAVLVAVAAVLGAGAQGVKVTTDAVVQRHVADAFRGRVFVVYDLLFNSALVTATALAALVLPDDGWSPPVLLALVTWWAALALLARHRP